MQQQQQRERQQQHPHQHLEPFGLKRIGSSRRQEQERGAIGTFCETGRDAASAYCNAQCGAVVFWDCRHLQVEKYTVFGEESDFLIDSWKLLEPGGKT